MRDEGFQSSTIATSVASARTAEKKWAKMAAELGPLAKNALMRYRPVLKRYARFLQNLPAPRWSEWDKFVAANFEATAAPQPRGSTRKPALTTPQWDRLVSAIQDGDESADHVLLIILWRMPESEPRAVLRSELRELPPAYLEVLDPKKRRRLRFLWSYIASTPYGAFARSQRQLKKRLDELDLEADFISLAKTASEMRAAGKTQ